MSLEGDIIQLVKDNIIANGNYKNIDVDSITVDSNIAGSGADHYTLEQEVANKYDIVIPFVDHVPDNREPAWRIGTVATIIETVQELNTYSHKRLIITG